MLQSDDLVQPVADLVIEAAERFVLPLYRHLSSDDISLKAPLDYVTRADRDVEAFLLPRLVALLPGSVTVGEESVHEDPGLLASLGNDLVWLVDPLDGTRNFVEGRPEFAIMVCLVAEGRAEMAWIYFPLLDKLILARRGEGVSINGIPAKAMTAVRSPPHGIVVHSGMPQAISQTLASATPAIGLTGSELYSAAADCLTMLEGRLDFVLYWRTMPWDHAPCCLALTEAGGACLRLDGQPYSPGDAKSGLVVTPDPAMTRRLARWMETQLA
ncbi:inositol monophosphatase family protein [Rhizobium puerariae]|uniref:Inositol monophosphatase family protein n=1 Tax=Rhizobium puerariae TaxID=1585791 RepID=A0ABV6AEC5_9HYPH